MREKVLKYIKQALREETLDVHYQPQFCKRNGCKEYKLVGAESLLCHDRTLCNTEYLFNVAEEQGLACDLGLYVMRRSMIDLREWILSGLVQSTFNLSINITFEQVRSPTFYQDVLTCINESQINPDQITLEVSEMSIVDDINITKLYQLSREGINISIDDFGVGYSSLSRLKLLPITEIKIDKSFTTDITRTTQDHAIMTAIFQLTQALSKMCVVEGVETKDQFEMLELIGFDCFQGFFFSHALDNEEFKEFVRLINSLHYQ